MDITKIIKQAAINAGEEILVIFNQHFERSFKEDIKNYESLVTEADIKSQTIIQGFIQNLLINSGIPKEEIGFIGEENLNIEGIHKFIVDPVDGTTNFSFGIPYFCISIGYFYRNTIKSGVVYNPVDKSIYYAEKEKKAYKEINGNEKQLQIEYKNLEDSDPLELLVATILSAQANDKLINQVTPALFAKYKSAKDYAEIALEELQNDLKRVNFYNNKAKSIKTAAKVISEKYYGKLPDTLEELDALPGVARKTANVVLGGAFKKACGIVVDTHVIRLTQKLALTDNKDPEKIEKDLMKIVPKENWIDFSLLLVNYGGQYCSARKHDCSKCPLFDLYT